MNLRPGKARRTTPVTGKSRSRPLDRLHLQRRLLRDGRTAALPLPHPAFDPQLRRRGLAGGALHDPHQRSRPPLRLGRHDLLRRHHLHLHRQRATVRERPLQLHGRVVLRPVRQGQGRQSPPARVRAPLLRRPQRPRRGRPQPRARLGNLAGRDPRRLHRHRPGRHDRVVPHRPPRRRDHRQRRRLRGRDRLHRRLAPSVRPAARPRPPRRRARAGQARPLPASATSSSPSALPCSGTASSASSS